MKMKTLEETQIALFAAYDIRNAMTSADRARKTDNDSFGESLDIVIKFLEAFEAFVETVNSGEQS